MRNHFLSFLTFAMVSVGILPGLAAGQSTELTSELTCSDFCTTGTNDYFPLWPGYALAFVGEEEDDGDLVKLSYTVTVLHETERINGVLTRVVEERELEDGELVEVSRNFVAICRETGDFWFFGEDVDDYEDGRIVGHEGAWRAGVDGAQAGIPMPGSPLLGARLFEENAPGVALDRAVDVTLPPCRPEATTLCLGNGRFRVEAEWRDSNGNTGPGFAAAACGDSGELWFFSPDNTELSVKVLDACGGAVPGFDSFWVIAAGRTDVEVNLTVTDTFTGKIARYEKDLGTPFEPIQDTSAFLTCDAVPGTGDDGDDEDDDGNDELHDQAAGYGADHPRLAVPLNNLGSLYWKLERYREAEPFRDEPWEGPGRGYRRELAARAGSRVR